MYCNQMLFAEGGREGEGSGGGGGGNNIDQNDHVSIKRIYILD